MLCTLVCFAALKFKCIFFSFAPFLPLLSPALCALLISSHLPCSLALYLYMFALFPLFCSGSLNFPPTYLLFPFYYYCDSSPVLCAAFFLYSVSSYVGYSYYLFLIIPPLCSRLLSSSTHGFIVTFTFNHPHPLSVKKNVLLLCLKIWILNGNSSIVLTETSLKSWADWKGKSGPL